jgi:hypothetical protein
LPITVQLKMAAMVRLLPLISSRINDGNWSKIASHVKATSVSVGHEADPGHLNLSVCYLHRRH